VILEACGGALGRLCVTMTASSMDSGAWKAAIETLLGDRWFVFGSGKLAVIKPSFGVLCLKYMACRLLVGKVGNDSMSEQENRETAAGALEHCLEKKDMLA
jgi:hypothetical protein